MPSFDALEESAHDGQPVSLYEFTLGNASWYYSGSAYPVLLGSVEYVPAAISDDGYSHNGEVGGDELQISMPASLEPATLYEGAPPFEPVMVKLRRYHHGATSEPVVWSGSIRSTNRKTSGMLDMTCRSLLASLDQLGLRLTWGRACPHGLYDTECRVDPDDFRVTASVTWRRAASLRIASLAGTENGYYSGGYIEFTRSPGGILDRIGIASQIDDTLTLIGTTDNIAVGQTINIYPGCSRTPPTCLNKFNNLLNYGGFPHLPDKNPFSGDPIF